MPPVDPLALHVDAVAGNVGVVRRRVKGWLGGVITDPDVVDDLVLAVSEAVENVVDHAFHGRVDVGSMRVDAHVDDEPAVVIAVSDDGSWQAPATGATTRGRGIAMMESLADAAVVSTDAAGTSVRLVHRL